MSDTFNPLEGSALKAICLQYPDVSELLRAQLATATIAERENTGSGFFTHFRVDHTLPRLSGNRVLDGPWFDVRELSLPMCFLLFVNDGYADCLEGASTGEDDTRLIDFSRVQFSLHE
ncbi:MAG: hypothetical protein EOS23_16415 [Mesorhizobium sp.]|uniref:hypothetical protein n=1 Tax=Mesorhizobium sp. TaxID=1871066 RepID=UPI000FE9C202|nr:hypothetical protein [Mesorhizobium sp.]RWD26785.1 MAG: hypothetical protein EOS34_32675 [Mesorhizobium sp.]RWE09960.1 MAG: hypothetical protein EOS23_16415 [Mesorhizobium sp.]TIR35491.1 MAG: hypothetical protein E5X35_04480 [Mesorhizobium sp.]TIS18648.1 MAG: hypothetical protein E5X07_31415 [Mesorhizobium sp.]TIW47811.1 MAG: hypothetical protein E5V71_03075 [Mesorhizobium sp.]